MEKIIVEANQTLFDIAAQYYGNAEAVGEILLNNPTLTNDPAALAQMGVDYIADRGFYMDIPVQPGTVVLIDHQSAALKQNTLRDINKPITTYGTNN